MKPEWQRASHYYRLAARVLPRSGNPHNQLAVMAVMAGEELRAMYHYARSLCVGLPFLTARENLLLLFEQNRARWGGWAGARPGDRGGCGGGEGLVRSPGGK